MLALEFAVNRSPVRLRPAAPAVARAPCPIKRRLELAVRHALGQRPAQTRRKKPFDRSSDRGFRKTGLPGDLAGRKPH